MIAVQGVGSFSVVEVAAKLTEHDEQIRGLERTVADHRKAIEACNAQIAEIQKVREPFRAALGRYVAK